MWPPLRPYMYSDLYPNSHLHAVRTGAVVKYPFICIGFWRREAESVTSSGTEMSVMVRERGGPRELNQGCWCCGGTKMRVVTASLQLWPTWASAGTLSSSQPPSLTHSLVLFLSLSLSLISPIHPLLCSFALSNRLLRGPPFCLCPNPSCSVLSFFLSSNSPSFTEKLQGPGQWEMPCSARQRISEMTEWGRTEDNDPLSHTDATAQTYTKLELT